MIRTTESKRKIRKKTFEYRFLIKIVSTFVAVMIKYILCILLGVILTSGLRTISDKDSQRFRTETGTVGIQSCTQSNYHVSKAIVKQSCKVNSSFGDEKCNGRYDCKMSDCVSGNSFFSRNLPPSKTLRFNADSVIVRLPSSFRFQLPEVRQTEISSYANLTKYSSRYYIYALGRILI